MQYVGNRFSSGYVECRPLYQWRTSVGPFCVVAAHLASKAAPGAPASSAPRHSDPEATHGTFSTIKDGMSVRETRGTRLPETIASLEPFRVGKPGLGALDSTGPEVYTNLANATSLIAGTFSLSGPLRVGR